MKGCFARKSTTLEAFIADFKLPLSHAEMMSLARRAWSDSGRKAAPPRIIKLNGRDTYKLKPLDVFALCLFAHSKDADLPPQDARAARFRACQREMFESAMGYMESIGADLLDMGGTLPDSGGDFITGMLGGIVRQSYAEHSAAKTVH